MTVLLAAGIGVVVGGILAIGFGIPVKEFSFGNTLILAGAVAVCTGLIMLSLSAVVRELRAIARRVGPADQAIAARTRSSSQPSVFATSEPGEETYSRDQAAQENAGGAEPPSAARWQEEATRDRVRQRGPAPPAPAVDESAPEAKLGRHLLFSSSSRKERERTAVRAPDSLANDLNSTTPAGQTKSVPSQEAGPRTLEDAWPASEPTRSEPYRRGGRTPSTFNAGAPAGGGPSQPARAEDRSEVTVLKSGVVDGMAYSLYSDGSIEAQMPEGMMRFTSIAELRAHLDQRS